MRADEWVQVIARVQAEWGRSQRWENAGEMAFDNRVIKLDKAWAMKAIDRAADEVPGQTAPAIRAVLKIGIEMQESDRRREQGLADCPHRNWAFNDQLDPPKEGRRLGTCVACGTEKWLPLESASEAGYENWPDLKREE